MHRWGEPRISGCRLAIDAAADGISPQCEAAIREQRTLQIRCDLESAAESRQAQLHAEAKAARARAKLAAIKASVSWRLTKPLRRLQAAFRPRPN